MEPKVILKTQNHTKDFELQNIINAFKPYIDSSAQYTIVSRLEENTCITQITGTNQDLLAQASQIIEPGNSFQEEKSHLVRQALKKTLYRTLCKVTGQQLPWGVLTGIRPTKIVHHYKAKHYGESSIRQTLREDYCISQEKSNLMIDIAEKEKQLLQKNKDKEVSIYIGIPFCPTRCLYCSFTSYSLDQKGDQLEAYLSALIKEMAFVAKAAKAGPIRSLYIGGGTPTSLNEAQFEKLLGAVDEFFHMQDIEEYTVEAGRPDTISRGKLRLMKQYGVDRISINPQTMNQRTLNIIGRNHQVKDIVDGFQMAREEGYENINMDLIVGLPGESVEDVRVTMEKIKDLHPDSMTVHTLAIKRASRLKQTMDDYELPFGTDIEKMLAITAEGANHMGMEAYYMYRQKDIGGNFENIGYATTGKECIYNVQMIAEQQTIIAVGAGAITKIIGNRGKRIKRIPNVKNLEEYIVRIDEMIRRKEGLLPH